MLNYLLRFVSGCLTASAACFTLSPGDSSLLSTLFTVTHSTPSLDDPTTPVTAVLRVRPFDRVHVLCDVPCFKEDEYSFDFLSLLKIEQVSRRLLESMDGLYSHDFQSINEVSGHENLVDSNDEEAPPMDVIRLTEVEDCRVFLRREMNEKVYDTSVLASMLPTLESLGSESVFKLDFSCSGRQKSMGSFVETKGQPGQNERLGYESQETQAEQAHTIGGARPELNKERLHAMDNTGPVNWEPSHVIGKGGSVLDHKRFVYSPVVMQPGLYTIRVGLDNLNFCRTANATMNPQLNCLPEKSTSSPKAYYHDRY